MHFDDKGMHGNQKTDLQCACYFLIRCLEPTIIELNFNLLFSHANMMKLSSLYPDNGKSTKRRHSIFGDDTQQYWKFHTQTLEKYPIHKNLNLFLHKEMDLK